MKQFFLLFYFRNLLLLSLFAGFISFNSSAQITYTSADFASAGDTFLVSKGMLDSAGNYNFAKAGANISWDYSGLKPVSQYTDQYLSAANTGYKLSFVTDCIAGGNGAVNCNNQWNALVNLGHLELDSVNYGSFSFSNEIQHYNKTTAALPVNILGLTFGLNGLKIPFVVTYTRPDTVYKFPLAYHNTDGSNSSYDIDLTSLGINFIYKSSAKRIDTIEGWGQLITPYKTFSSTLKLKTLVINYDTAILNGSSIPVPITTDVTYSWFDNSYKRPVLSVSGLLTGNATVITNIEFLDTIRCLDPLASFIKSPLVPYINESTQNVVVSFTNTSVNSNEYSWNFGDPASAGQNISVVSNPTHTYSRSGTFIATLISCNDICQPLRCDTIDLPVTIFDSTNVQANFSYFPLQPCVNDTINFTNLSLNAISYNWDFGDNTTSSIKNPSKIYSASGVYTITLIAKGSTTSDTIMQQITVLGIPTAVITPSDSVGICAGDSITLSASGGNYYLWSTGAVTSSITVFQPDNYSVKAYNNCGSNLSQPIVVNFVPAIVPTISIQSITGDTICAGSNVLCNAIITNGGIAPMYKWYINNNIYGSNTDTFSYSGFQDSDTVTCVLTSNASCATMPQVNSNAIIMSVDSLPAVPVISQVHDTLIATAAYLHQWFWNDTLISNSNYDTLIAAQTGQYRVEITDSNGCHNISGVFYVASTGVGDMNSVEGIELFPNPNNGIFTLNLKSIDVGRLLITDIFGKAVYQEEKLKDQYLFDFTFLPAGVYLLRITQGTSSIVKKLSIVK